MTKIEVTTPVTEASKYAYPPGISGDIHDQTFHCENPDQPGFVNNQIGLNTIALSELLLSMHCQSSNQ